MYKNKILLTFFLLIFVNIVAVVLYFQNRTVPVEKSHTRSYKVGIISHGGAHEETILGLKEGMRLLGYKDGEDIIYTEINAQGSDEKAKEAAEQLIADKVDLIYSITTPITGVVSKITTEIPIVFNLVSDPVDAGFAKSMLSSGTNMTGCSNAVAQTGAKRLEFLQTVMPSVKSIVVLYDPNNKFSKSAIVILRNAATTLGLQLTEKHIFSRDDIVKVMSEIESGEYDAFFHLGEAKVSGAVKDIIARTNIIKLPTMAHAESFVRDGMLIAYGPSWHKLGVQCASITDKVLKGTSPSDIPIQLPERLEFFLNLTTAKLLNLELSKGVLLRVDKFIE